jgi:DNA-binding IclR family transcriptional regulator
VGRVNVAQRWTKIERSARGEESPLVQGFARGFAVLRAFRPGENYLSNAQIALRTGIPRPTVSRLTQTLTALGFLAYAPSLGEYSLGGGLASLCHSLLSGMPYRLVALPSLQELADYSKLPVSLAMRDQLDMVYIETARHAGTKPPRFDLGSRIPIGSTAMGRAYLYGLPANERRTLFESIRLACGESRWKSISTSLKLSFSMLDRKGFCLSVGEWRKDVVGVGAPVVTNQGTVLAINCGGPPSEVGVDWLEHEIGPRLAQAASRIAARGGLASESGASLEG